MLYRQDVRGQPNMPTFNESVQNAHWGWGSKSSTLKCTLSIPSHFFSNPTNISRDIKGFFFNLCIISATCHWEFDIFNTFDK